MAWDLSGTGQEGSGYGGGGCGGGEYANGKFATASAGKGGYAAYIQFRHIYGQTNKHILVNYNNKDYPTYHFTIDTSIPSSITYQKVTASIAGLTNRCYNINGLKVSTPIKDSSNIEINSSGVTGNFKSVTTKVKPSIGGENLKLVINTSNTNTNSNDIQTDAYFPGQIWKGEAGPGGTLSGTIYAGDVIVFILQGGGGGGGGADNDWSLFNYADGGGGGGAGGACVYWFSSGTDRLFTINVGKGGSAGTTHGNDKTRTNGGNGGTTSVTIYNNTGSNSGTYAYLNANGGSGGGKASSGGGGAGGQIAASHMNKISIIDGGAGGSKGNSGGTGGSSGDHKLTIGFPICPVTITVNPSTGTAGTTGSLDDRGGGGGASWLGNGGHY